MLHKAKLSALNAGRQHSAETKAKCAAKAKGVNIGRVASEETKAKLSAMRKGVPKSPEHKAAIKAAHLARKK